MFLAARRRSARFAFAFAGSMMSAAAAYANSPSSFDLGNLGVTPHGYVDWCNENENNCKDDLASKNEKAVVMTAELWEKVSQVNEYWNIAIIPATDKETYGVTEKWMKATKGMKGDCEDVMLAKRGMLIEEFKFPREALLMTLVKDEKGEGHAVLTLRTTVGDFILNNQTNAVLRWDHTKLTFISAMSRGLWRTVLTEKPAYKAPVIQADFPLPKDTQDAPRPAAEIPNKDPIGNLIEKTWQTTTYKATVKMRPEGGKSHLGLRLNTL